MSKTLKLVNGDLSIVGGQFQYTYGIEEIEQRILITLQHNWQEYFLNFPAGVPWYDFILGGKDLKLYEAILRSIILDVPGVDHIVSFDMSLVNRKLTISTVVLVVWNQITVPITISSNSFTYLTTDTGQFLTDDNSNSLVI